MPRRMSPWSRRRSCQNEGESSANFSTLALTSSMNFIMTRARRCGFQAAHSSCASTARPRRCRRRRPTPSRFRACTWPGARAEDVGGPGDDNRRGRRRNAEWMCFWNSGKAFRQAFAACGDPNYFWISCNCGEAHGKVSDQAEPEGPGQPVSVAAGRPRVPEHLDGDESAPASRCSVPRRDHLRRTTRVSIKVSPPGRIPGGESQPPPVVHVVAQDPV